MLSFIKLKKSAFLAELVLLTILSTGCGIAPWGQSSETEKVSLTSESEIEQTVDPVGEPIEVVPPDIDFMTVRPNELGEVMVIMYHRLEAENTDYARTPEAFRQDLKRLYDMGFRTISLRDFVSGKIDVPAGYTPVILTFDDAHISNFRCLEDQSVDPESAVGILMEFAGTYPDFGTHASFFLNAGIPFGQKKFAPFKLEFLLENGMDVGNHSFGHEHFKKMTASEVEVSLGKTYAFFKSQLPEGYQFNMLALPFGERPVETERSTLIEGQYEGMNYQHIAILNVGWKPSVSSFDKLFDFTSIQRVQSGDGQMQLKYWLDQYELHPEKRFVSDGRNDRIVFPERLSEKLDPQKTGDRSILMYKDTE